MLSEQEMEKVLDSAGNIFKAFIFGVKALVVCFILTLLALLSSVGYIVYSCFN